MENLAKVICTVEIFHFLLTEIISNNQIKLMSRARNRPESTALKCFINLRIIILFFSKRNQPFGFFSFLSKSLLHFFFYELQIFFYLRKICKCRVNI